MAALTKMLVTLSMLVPFSMATAINLLEPRQASTYTCHGDYTYTPGAGYHCDYAATLRAAANPTSNTTVSSFNACVKACKTDSSCLSFGFANATSDCLIYDVTVDSQKPKSGNTDTMYWNHRCYEPTVLSSTPIVNSDFSTGGVDPWVLSFSGDPGPIQGGEVVSPGSGNNPYAIQLDGSAAGNATSPAGTTLEQSFPCCAQTKYTLGYEFYQVPNQTVISASGSPYYQAGFHDPTGKTTTTAFYVLNPDDISGQPAGTWGSVVFNAKSTKSGMCVYAVQLFTQPDSSASLQFDQLVVTEVPPAM